MSLAAGINSTAAHVTRQELSARQASWLEVLRVVPAERSAFNRLTGGALIITRTSIAADRVLPAVGLDAKQWFKRPSSPERALDGFLTLVHGYTYATRRIVEQ